MPLNLASQFTQKTYTWSNWKQILSSKDGIHQYEDDGRVYTVYFYDGPEVHLCTIWKNIVPQNISSSYSQEQNDADKEDFESNYLSTANKKLIENVVSIPTQYGSTTFGEARTADPYTLVDIVNKYEIDTRQYGLQTSTGGSIDHVPEHSAIRLSVNNSSGSSAKLKSHTFYRYQAGKEMVIKQTIYLSDDGYSNQIKRWGFFDNNDGLIWELNSSTFRIVRRTSTSGAVVNNYIDQTSWNFDKMDGSGPSRAILDLTKSNIYEIHLAWLGVGIVQFFINGKLVHILDNPNIFIGPYMRTAQLPLNYEIINSDNSNASSITFICASILIQGGSEPEGTTFAAFTTSPIVVSSNSEIPIITIRPKAIYNGIVNRGVLFPFLASISTSGFRISYRIIMNASLTGSNFTSVNSTSLAEYDISATSFSGGETLLYGFLGGSNDANNNIRLEDFFKEQGRKLRQDAFETDLDTLTITAINEFDGTTNVKASVSWREVR